MGKIKYNIGLDIGTSSVGWSVTDENGHLMKHQGKNTWGVRLFEEGETAATRRMYRSTRRRLGRRKQRINKLQEIFIENMNELDREFFTRLKESFLHIEDKNILSSSILFDDHEYSDVNYYKKYPTIYHVRKDLIDSKGKKDLRLIYLALHNILKYRGHFLYGKVNFGKVSANINSDLEHIFSNVLIDSNDDITSINYTKMKEILSSSDRPANKQDGLHSLLLGKDKAANKIIKEIIKAVLGYKFNLKNLFKIESAETIKTISFQEEIDEMEVEGLLGEEVEIFHALKAIYSWVTLEELLGNIKSQNPEDKTISSAMIAKFDKHKRELKMLKNLIKEICSKEDYNDLFRREGKGHSYTNYIKGITYCTLEQLNKNIKMILNKYPLAKEHKYYHKLNEALTQNQLLAKLNTVDNAVIPYQLHKSEMEKIIDTQGKYYPFLVENKELLIKMLESKIPYYVGPLNKHSDFSWVEKTSDKKGIYPWNYEEIVDIDKTAEAFIKRMTNKCTYLKEEDVLPRHSLIYSEFVLLNELNKVRINKRLISRDSKRKIIEDVFKNKKTVKTSDIVKWVRTNPNGYIIKSSDNITVEGTQKENEFASSLASYYDFKRLFGEIDKSNVEMIEEIINWITIFEDKEILKRKIKEKYALPKNQIDRIMNFNYSGWARLSDKLINGIRNYKISESSRHKGSTILDIMWETNRNFMQIINDKNLDFQERIEELNPLLKKRKFAYEDIQELQGSPGIKRGVWETVKIIEEVVKVMGAKPDNIFMEFSRSDEAPRRTNSRVNRMKQLYEEIKKDVYMYNKEGYDKTYKTLQKRIKANDKLDNRALYLYFTQNGKCMYTGESLNPEQLSLYQIDHIMPQSYIKDDSMDNLVLVTTKANQVKKDNLILDFEVRNKQYHFWESLLKNGLIGRKKYENLNRDIIPDKEIIGFINRQLVETRQISKHVADLLSEVYEDTKIISIKAKLVSDYRKQYDFYKNRDINDYHHANDALITSVIGNFIIKRYPKFEDELNIKAYINNFKEKGMHTDNRNKYGFVLASMNKDYKGEDFTWEKDKEISKVKKALSYKDCFITKKIKEQTGQLFDETIYGAGHPKAKIPRKEGLDPKKYGGYSGVTNAYYLAIAYEKGKKIISKVVSIPIYKLPYIQEWGIERYIIEEEKIKNQDTLKILKAKIKRYQLVEYQGHKVYLISDGEQQNAVQLIVDNKYSELLYKISSGNILSELEREDEYDDLMVSFFDYYYEKLKTHYPLYENLLEDIKNSRVDYINFDISQKADFIKQLLMITKASAASGRFKIFNTTLKKEDAGRMRRVWKIEDMIFIDQSITGLFERRYGL